MHDRTAEPLSAPLRARVVREALKTLAHGVAMVLALPAVASFALRRSSIGADRALEGSTQALSLLPGVPGEYVRRAFLSFALAECHRSATIRFGTIFSKTGARIGANAYVGPGCQLGLVHLESNVLLAAGVHIPSGGASHGTGDVNQPIREQPGALQLIHVGEGTWVGSRAVVLADVGRHSVVGAGAVVTRPIPDYAVALGVPARVVRSRLALARDGTTDGSPPIAP